MDRDDDNDDEAAPPASQGRRLNRLLGVLLLLACLGLGAYAWKVHSQGKRIEQLTAQAKALKVSAPGSIQSYRLKPNAARPGSPDLALGWLNPPQLLDLRIDVAESRFNTFQVTLDKRNEARILQIRRMARDSNGELRLNLNSSAFGPGEYELKLEGYNWRGELADAGWLVINLE